MARKQLGVAASAPTDTATFGDLASFPRVVMFGTNLATVRGAGDGPRIWVGQGVPTGYVEATDLLIQTFESNKIDLVYNTATSSWPARPTNLPAGVVVFWWSLHAPGAPVPPEKTADDYLFDRTS